MTKAEQRDAELLALGKDIAHRRESIITEYKKTHVLPSRGRILAPELLELEKEEVRRFREIINKYKE